MLIKVLKPYRSAITGIVHNAGELIEKPADRAKNLIGKGFAEEFKEKPKRRKIKKINER